MYTFKNTGSTKIPVGCKLLWIAGDQELNVSDAATTAEVRPDAFFKIRVNIKAPDQSRHFKAAYQLIDLAGNTFGDKVDLDIIVEDDCSESVILQELMDGGDNMMANMSML